MALFTPNSAEIGAVTFGTHWAGGVVCPFNNLYTVGELVSQLRSSEAKALTTNVACLEVAREAALIAGLPLDRIILVGEHDPKGRFEHFSTLQSTSTDVQRVPIDPKLDLAFLVYSSGTTGLPKGVMLSHENVIANLLQAHILDLEHTHWSTDRTIGFLPMYHIYGRQHVSQEESRRTVLTPTIQASQSCFLDLSIEELQSSSCKDLNRNCFVRSLNERRLRLRSLSHRLSSCWPNIRSSTNTI